MSHDSSRRPSVIPFGAQEAIPTPPPLPASRPLQRARDAATRFFGYHSRSASPQRSPEDERILSRGRSRYASLSATQNATASHRTGLEINTLAINETGTHAVLGGKEIFRTVKVEDGTFAIGFDLRSAIRSTPTHASGKARQAYSVDIADVAWAKGDCGSYVAAATSSGKIVLYDLGHAGIQAAQLHEHFRQVHKVTFNPHRGCLLLSGSQDGTVRLWDVRDSRQASTLQSKRKYSGQSDGVRDVKWSPTDGVDFAFGTDSGWIQRWDMRNLATAKVKIPAHSETCNAIDWHPDGKHIASASSDKTVRVWDFSTSRKQQKASWEIKTPYRVSNARWRPPCESSPHGEFGPRQCTQLITTYDQEHPVVHVWDVRRQALPFRELFPFNAAPTDLLWHSQDLVWMVGKEGTFLQADIQHAPKIIDKRNMQAFTTSSLGDITFVRQTRPRPRPRHALLPPQRARSSMDSKPGGQSQSQSPQHDSMLSRSWADDGLDQSFLQPRTETPATQQLTGLIRAPSVWTTTSSNDLSSPTVTDLDEVLASQKSVRPRQDVVHARLPYSLDPKLFAFMASNYKVDLTNIPDDENFLKSFEALFEHNARVAYTAGLYRTAQSWRVLCTAMTCHLKKRAEMNLQRAMANKPFVATPRKKGTLVEIMHGLMRDTYVSPASSPSMKPVSAIAQQLALSDVASDQPTPLAKPTSTAKATMLPQDIGLPDLDKEVALTLPPSISPPVPRIGDILHSQDESESKLTTSNLHGFQKLQQTTVEADKRAMVRRWSIQPKEPLCLDPVDVNGIKIQSPKLQRHDSNESFTFLGGSSNSRDPSYPSSYEDRGSGPLEMVSERPSKATGRYEGDVSSGVEAQDFDDRPEASPTAQVSNLEALSGRPRSSSKLSEAVAGHNETLSKALENEYNYPAMSVPGGDPVSYLTGQQGQPMTDHDPTTAYAAVKEDDRTSQGRSRIEGPSSTAAGTNETPPLYRPGDGDDDLEEDKPFRMVEMLRELVKHYTDKGDAQTAAQMVLALTPLLPRTHPLPELEASQTVSAYMDCFTSMGYSPDEVENIFQEHLDPLVQSGMQPLQVEAILCTYHEHLMRRKLWNEAAALRKLAYPMYPSVYEDAVKDNHVSVRCGSCHQPIKSGMARLRCESCGVKQAPCVYCECEESPYDEKKSKLMTTCLRCHHTYHSACLQAWFEEGDGGCPTIGCLCDCVDGSWRQEKARMASAL